MKELEFSTTNEFLHICKRQKWLDLARFLYLQPLATRIAASVFCMCFVSLMSLCFFQVRNNHSGLVFDVWFYPEEIYWTVLPPVISMLFPFSFLGQNISFLCIGIVLISAIDHVAILCCGSHFLHFCLLQLISYIFHTFLLLSFAADALILPRVNSSDFIDRLSKMATTSLLTLGSLAERRLFETMPKFGWFCAEKSRAITQGILPFLPDIWCTVLNAAAIIFSIFWHIFFVSALW